MIEESDDYYRGFYDGFNSARSSKPIEIEPNPYPPRASIKALCPICTKDLNQLTHYCCPRQDCPSNVSCLSVSGVSS